MAALKSKKKFKAEMEAIGLVEGVDYLINFEAYGRKVEGYIYPIGEKPLSVPALAHNVESLGGFRVRAQPSRVIIQVSYFKAYHWDE